MNPTDDRLYEAFGPLASDEPPEAELDALLTRLDDHGARKPPRVSYRRRRPLSIAGAIAMATAAVVVALAALPGVRPDRDRTRHVWGDQPVLAAAAAVAAEQQSPPRASYRYARVKDRLTYVVHRGGEVGFDNHERIAETWISERWRGREIGPAGRSWFTGDESLRAEVPRRPDVYAGPTDRPFLYGDGPLAELDPRELPKGRDELARVLLDGIRTNRWGGYPADRGRPTGIPDDENRAHLAYSIILLLTYARLEPEQRAALLDVLSAQAEARDLGEVEDEAGRKGRAVELSFPIARRGDNPETYRVIFDPQTSEILQWTMLPHGDRGSAWAPNRTVLVLDTGYTDEIGTRP